MVHTVAVFKLAHGDARSFASANQAHGTPDRRGPNRATNVTRPDFAAKAKTVAKPEAAGNSVNAPAATAEPAKTGTDSWESF